MKFFIRQFENPTGSFGIFLSGIMNLSNKRMYKANIRKLDGRRRILEIGFGSGRQLEMILIKTGLRLIVFSGTEKGGRRSKNSSLVGQGSGYNTFSNR